MKQSVTSAPTFCLQSIASHQHYKQHTRRVTPSQLHLRLCPGHWYVVNTVPVLVKGKDWGGLGSGCFDKISCFRTPIKFILYITVYSGVCGYITPSMQYLNTLAIQQPCTVLTDANVSCCMITASAAINAGSGSRVSQSVCVGSQQLRVTSARTAAVQNRHHHHHHHHRHHRQSSHGLSYKMLLALKM